MNVWWVYVSMWGSSQLFQAASKLVSLLSCHNTLPISLTLAHGSLLRLLRLSVKWPRVTSLTLRRLVYDDDTIVHLLNVFSELRTLDIGFVRELYNLYAGHMGTVYPLVAHKSPVLQSLSYAPELGVTCSIQSPVISTLLCSLQLTNLHVVITSCWIEGFHSMLSEVRANLKELDIQAGICASTDMVFWFILLIASSGTSMNTHPVFDLSACTGLQSLTLWMSTVTCNTLCGLYILCLSVVPYLVLCYMLGASIGCASMRAHGQSYVML